MKEIKNEIKSIIVSSGITMSELVSMLNEKYNRDDSISNLSNKLTRGTIKYKEAKEIADVLGYDIKWVKK